MGNLLFSPNGRIGPQRFLKGAIIIGVIGALLCLTGFLNVMIFAFAIILACLLVIPFILMGIKRAHDAGKSGWFNLVYVVIGLVVYFALTFVLTLIGLAPSTAEQLASQERLEEVQGSGDIAEVMAVMNDVMGPLIIPTALVFLLTPVIAAFVANLISKQDPHENQYGLVPS